MADIQACLTILFLALASSVSVDCPNMVNLAGGLGMPGINLAIWNSLQNDCCSAAGVVCVSEHVTEIQWYGLGLNGVINGTAIPSSVTVFDLSRNQVSGSIPQNLPAGLSYLQLAANYLSGGLPPSFPSALTYLSLGLNGLTGSIPSAPFPSTLGVVSFGGNYLSGSIPDNLPTGLQELILDHNYLTGAIPSLPNGLVNLYLYSNRLSGDLPIFPPTIRLLRLGYPGKPGNQFSGSLKLNSPVELHINDNWIADIFIQDTRQLSACDLSNNPLLGNPNLVNLTMCTKNALYNASLLPNTVTHTTQSKTITENVKSTGWLTISLTMRDNLMTSMLNLTFAQNLTESVSLHQTSSFIIQSLTESQNQLSSASADYSFQTLKRILTTMDLMKIILRLLIDTLVLISVLIKTPTMRELRRKFGRKNRKVSEHNFLQSK